LTEEEEEEKRNLGLKNIVEGVEIKPFK